MKEGNMKKKTYRILLVGNRLSGVHRLKEVCGKPIVIEGFTEFEFFISRSKNRWAVSELSSGAQVGAGDTKSEAIINATSELTHFGSVIVKQQIAKIKEEYYAVGD
mgnify:CR=1 FL=1